MDNESSEERRGLIKQEQEQETVEIVVCGDLLRWLQDLAAQQGSSVGGAVLLALRRDVLTPKL